MSRTIFCTFLQREAEGQDFQLYPGELGKRIYNEISKEAWAQWQHKQTMLINEKKLNMMNAEHRKLLEQEMVNFLFEGKEVHIEGFTPEDKNKKQCRSTPPATCIKTNTTRTRNDEKISRAGFDCAVAHLLFDDQKRRYL